MAFEALDDENMGPETVVEEERLQYVDPETNQLYWLSKEQWEDLNG